MELISSSSDSSIPAFLNGECDIAKSSNYDSSNTSERSNTKNPFDYVLIM